MIIKCQVLVSSLLLIPKAKKRKILSRTFPRVLKAMAQSTRSSQRTSAEERALEVPNKFSIHSAYLMNQEEVKFFTLRCSVTVNLLISTALE